MRPDCALQVEIRVESTLDGWRRGVGRKSCKDNRIIRKIRFVGRHEGDPTDLKERREEGIGFQTALMHVAARFPQQVGDTTRARIYCRRVGYGVD